MIEKFTAPEIIALKRDKKVLSDEQIDWVVDAYTRGAVADEQMSALAMAILLNGMQRHEISCWTDAMIRSGERMDWSMLDRPTVDKHSTGGVGDKITLPLVPLVASCGAAVPQLSGRGLGHTGGTLDKLESISGWRASLSNSEMLQVIKDTGGVICAAGAGLAPADKKLYALRDVTATVEAIPLIASSIMSKKIAEGTGSLVLDVKTGTGAFMSDPLKARELATVMVEIGKSAGLNIRALITCNISEFESEARQPGIDSNLSKVPPVWPNPLPDSCGTAAPHDATNGTSGKVILSPTPPVECLSTVGRSNIDQSIRSPLRIIASVQRLISWRCMPFKRIAMASADICSSATAPRVYASTTQSICSSLKTCLSRFSAMISGAVNFSIIT